MSSIYLSLGVKYCSEETYIPRDHLFCLFFVIRQSGLWQSVMSICLVTEVKEQWAMLVLG